jgi:hypothetical protein
MKMTLCVQSAFVPAEDIELGTVETRPARFAASARAALES